MRKKIADSLYKLYDGDFSHFPKWLKRILNKTLKDYRFLVFDKFSFPNVGKYEYSNLIKIGDEWFVHKTWIPYIWPELSIKDICNVQPMSGHVGLSFKINYTYEK